MDSIAFVAFTRAGCACAVRLASELPSFIEYSGAEITLHAPCRIAEGIVRPFESLAAWMAECFPTHDALVFVGATGIAVRAIAPFVEDKFSDPAVVSIDEVGRFAVPLLSGHVGGANGLARALASLSGGQAVISTATDVNDVFAVDEWAMHNGLQVVERDVAKQMSAHLLEGGTVAFASEVAGEWELPEQVRVFRPGETPGDIGFVVSLDIAFQPFKKTLHLVPRWVTVGVGCRKGVEPDVLDHAIDAALAQAGVSPLAVRALATIDVKRGEPAIEYVSGKRGWDVRYYHADELEAVLGDFPESAFVEQAVGVGNVCERAAVACGGSVLLGKQAGDGVTVALGLREERSRVAAGRLSVVGLGPGGSEDLTLRARKALGECEVIVGYPVYTDLVTDAFPGREVLTTPMRKELERCQMAWERAAQGKRVVLVCSGDPGVYGMAGPVLEMAKQYPEVEVRVVPGVTAATGGAAVLGAPLMHDWCCISLSDLMTTWERIERRLRAAAQSDFAVVLYNPSSRKRAGHLRRACDILLEYRDARCVCGMVRNIGRAGQECRLLTLEKLRDAEVDMFTTVFVGTSQTKVVDGRMVTPRGYRMQEDR